MSQEPKNKEEGFMYKFASFIVDKRNLIFLIVAIGLVFSVFSRSWVQVENQLSAYLPKESETYKGLHLMEDEFTTFGTAKLMLVNVSYDEAQAVSEQIADIDGVQGVSFDDTRDHYTNASALYDITFDYSEDDDRCETVMNDIESALGRSRSCPTPSRSCCSWPCRSTTPSSSATAIRRSMKSFPSARRSSSRSARPCRRSAAAASRRSAVWWPCSLWSSAWALTSASA